MLDRLWKNLETPFHLPLGVTLPVRLEHLRNRTYGYSLPLPLPFPYQSYFRIARLLTKVFDFFRRTL
ncbi:hypothetical protein [Laspinema palackyanum]|uniref:hypothetical protein n=1 Tax=Laspinema palackyanum TaxID=3231601 RepID=UPI00345CA411|nr:hypothetical protein [Laspinema sp. D2c]MCT7960483.1 hypothetical protein [Laspinema sp. D2b]